MGFGSTPTRLQRNKIFCRVQSNNPKLYDNLRTSGQKPLILPYFVMARKKTTHLFEDSLQELEQLVEQMEKGDLSLEDSLKTFERGVKLTQTCQQALQEAEHKVQILLEKNGEYRLEPFDNE